MNFAYFHFNHIFNLYDFQLEYKFVLYFLGENRQALKFYFEEQTICDMGFYTSFPIKQRILNM